MGVDVKTCSCGNSEFKYDYKVKADPVRIKFGKVSGYKEVVYSCTRCGNRYFMREELD